MGDVEVIHPYDNKHIILGQSTIGKEFIEDIPNLDAIIVPVSGGGLLSGVLSYVKKINPSIKFLEQNHQKRMIHLDLFNPER